MSPSLVDSHLQPLFWAASGHHPVFLPCSLETRKHKLLCADSAERWVQKAMEHLDRRAAVLTPNGGTFEKQIGMGEPRTTLSARRMDGSAATEPQVPGETGGQEAQRASGTTPEQRTGAAASWETGSPSVAQGLGGDASTGSTRALPFSSNALTTEAISWHSSVASQAGSELWAEGKASEGSPTATTPTAATPTTATPTQAPSTPATPSQTSSPQVTPSQATPSQAPSPQLPTTVRSVPEDIIRPTGQRAGAQDLLPEGSLGPQDTGPVSALPSVFMGSGSIPHISAVPISSEWDPSREPVASGSWAPKAEETVHATVDPQRLGVLITPYPDSQVATRRQAVGLLAFLGLLFCVGVAMFAYQSLQGCPRKMAGEMVEGLRYVPRSCGSNSYVLVPV